MSGLELETREILDRFVPERRDAGDWSSVLREATQRPRRRWRFGRVAVGVAAATSVALALTLAWPFGGGSGGLLDRALAAAGSGPVLHAVLELHPGGSIIDLSSGRIEQPLVVLEQWFAPAGDLRERVIRSTGGADGPTGAVTKRQALSGDYSSALAGFVQGYRDALRRGDAQVVEQGTISGRGVAWIRFSQGAPLGMAYEVAVDEETGDPLYLRTSALDRPGGHYSARVLKLESVDDVPAVSSVSPWAGVFRMDPQGEVTPVEARDALERPALWLGPTFQGKDLATMTLLQFTQAPGPRPDWNAPGNETWKGLNLVYGGVNGQPAPNEPFVQIEEQTRQSVRAGAPAEGSVLIQGEGDGAGGLLQKDGVYMLITASTRELILEAARALKPIP
jgi:hypothetical protein